MNRLQEKLDFLLEKYSIETNAVLKDEKTVVIDGKEIPTLPHRSERRFLELKNIVNNGTLAGVSVMRTARIVDKDRNIYEELYREMDLCEYILQRNIKSVMAMENGNVLNVIASTEDGVVCTIEISASLLDGEKAKDKHEIISQRGIACDVVVDAQLKQESVYVFGSENKKFTDVDFELYGLSIKEVAVVRAAFAVAQKKNYEEMTAEAANLQKLVEMAKRSAKSGEREVMSE